MLLPRGLLLLPLLLFYCARPRLLLLHCSCSAAASTTTHSPRLSLRYTPGQEYRPHCDGACDGSPHLHGGRVATMLMYCETADSGGATSFTKANLHVQPERLSAVFFSYKDKLPGEGDAIMDDGLTEHSGCPVREGKKWVITQWMREGVSAEEGWEKFDPLGARL